MVGNQPQRLRIANTKTFLDVFLQYCCQQALNLASLVAKILHFWETAVVDIIHKCDFPSGDSLGGDALREIIAKLR